MNRKRRLGTQQQRKTVSPEKNALYIRKLSDMVNCRTVYTVDGKYRAEFDRFYRVIEDNFPNGRPELEKAGLYFTDRETVDKVEKMKVCTCLNPLHTALAIFGNLLGFTLIADEMKDEDLVKLVNILGYKEGLPVVVDPKILSPKAFIDEVVQKRIPNPLCLIHHSALLAILLRN